MRRHALRIAIPACAAAVGMAPVAAHADIVPAPPSHASGVAAQVGSLLDLSRTDATADPGAPSAQASVIRLAGQPLLGLGGTQHGDGQTGGSLADTGSTLPVHLQVAPWHAAAAGSAGPTRHATSSAAVARADAAHIVRAGVLTSESDASFTDQKSTGTAMSDGAHVGVFDDLNIVLLHSEVSSEGRGHSYLAGVNNTQIGTDDQLGASPLCGLAVPAVASLSCLTASGGSGIAGGATSGGAQVVNLAPAVDGLGALNPVAAFTAAATSGSGAAPTSPAPVPAVAAGETSRAATSPAPPTGTDITGQTLERTSGRLPRTGANLTSLIGSALTMLLAGIGLRRLHRRPATR